MLEIKTDIIPTVKSKMLGLVHYTDGKKFYTKCMISDVHNDLIKFLDVQKRDIILNIIQNYVAHREYLFEKNHSEQSQIRINAINKLKQALQVYKNGTSYKLLEIVICLEKDILAIMPGLNSKYYNYYNESINQLLTYCKNTYHEQSGSH